MFCSMVILNFAYFQITRFRLEKVTKEKEPLVKIMYAFHTLHSNNLQVESENESERKLHHSCGSVILFRSTCITVQKALSEIQNAMTE